MSEQDDARLARLAERLAELRDEKRYLESEIEKVSAELADVLEPGFKGPLGSVTVRVSPGRRTLRITCAEDVPPSLCSLQPDRKAILAHLDTGAPPPAGTETSHGRPIVTVTA